MPSIRGITTCVNYAELLAITLPMNLRHLTECIVITSPDDERTQEVACSLPNVKLHVTSAFVEHGARFNKGYALEHAWDTFGRSGWWWIWDADCLFPDHVPLDRLREDVLHGCRRRICDPVERWSPELDWHRCPISRDGGAIGYTQIFNGDDSTIRDKRPWYDVSFAHAGGGDAAFMAHWDAGHKVVLPFDVLHLGKTDCNWFGVDPEGTDMMARFVHENGWRGAMRKHSLEAVQRSKEVVHRVQVPGYDESNFELPFVRRAKQTRGQS